MVLGVCVRATKCPISLVPHLHSNALKIIHTHTHTHLLQVQNIFAPKRFE